MFSSSKTKCCVSLKLNGDDLEQVNICRYLGVIVDSELKWISHIEVVFQKLNRLVGICYKLSYKLPDWCLRDIYFAFVHPHVLYCIEVYGNTCGSYMDKLTKLNNKIDDDDDVDLQYLHTAVNRWRCAKYAKPVE